MTSHCHTGRTWQDKDSPPLLNPSLVLFSTVCKHQTLHKSLCANIRDRVLQCAGLELLQQVIQNLLNKTDCSILVTRDIHRTNRKNSRDRSTPEKIRKRFFFLRVYPHPTPPPPPWVQGLAKCRLDVGILAPTCSLNWVLSCGQNFHHGVCSGPDQSVFVDQETHTRYRHAPDSHKVILMFSPGTRAISW